MVRESLLYSREIAKRMAWGYIPQGAYMPNWMPTTEGENFELTPSLEPMAEHRKEMIVFGGLTCDKGRANEYRRARWTFLAQHNPLKALNTVE